MEPNNRAPDEVIETLSQVSDKYIGGPKRLLAAARAAGTEINLTENALRLILDGKTQSPRGEHKVEMATFVNRTPFGRAAAALGAREAPAADQLIRKLLWTSVDPAIAGCYFLYHPSISHPEHYTIRALKIKCEDEFVFNVYDYFVEDTSGAHQERISHGIVIKTQIGHQIVTLNEHRASGLQVIAVEDVIDKYSILNGNMFGSERDGNHFCVGARLVRSKMKLDQMRPQTGAFSLEALSKPEFEEHRGQFKLLAEFPARQRPRTALERLSLTASTDLPDDPAMLQAILRFTLAEIARLQLQITGMLSAGVPKEL